MAGKTSQDAFPENKNRIIQEDDHLKGTRILVLFSLSVCFLSLLIINLAPGGTSLSKDDPPEMKPFTETIPGSNIKFDMVSIPGGSFLMGSPATEPKRSNDEGPMHEVKIRPFWMGKAEVTWNEFDLFAFSKALPKPPEPDSQSTTTADAVSRPTPPYADPTFGLGHDNQPVISITHHAAMEYCRWLSAKTGKIYRLPTEAEWEYACRAGSKTAYSFGDDPAQLKDYAWYLDNADGKSHPVAQKKPNPWGLYDMHGNVAEWCLDHYDAGFYSTFPANSITPWPVLLPTEKRYPHVVRGGSWDDEAVRCRSAARRASEEDWSMLDPQQPKSIWWHTNAIMIGFRVVHPFEEQDNLKGLKSKVIKEKSTKEN
jgi:formylglycine-generating enzyme required for sulfatase activity